MIDLAFLNPISQRVLRLARGNNVENPFGSGVGGDVVISGDTTLSPPYLHYNNLTIDATFSLTGVTASPLIIVVKNTLTVNGTLHANGLGSAGGAAGTAGTAGSYWNWGNVTNVAGGAGGTTAGVGAGPGLGGGVSRDANAIVAFMKDNLVRLNLKGAGGGGAGVGPATNGGAGGAGLTSGGGGGGNNTSGGAGSASGAAGGGSLIIIARNIVVGATGTISANGSDGTNTGNQYDGGSGGGSGGGLVLVYRSLSNGGSIVANGGRGGPMFSGTLGGAGGTSSITDPFQVSAGSNGTQQCGGGGGSGIVMPLQI